MSDETSPVPATALHEFVVRALQSTGVPAHDAAAVAHLMVDADLYGYDTHGVFRLRQYLARLKDGGCNPTAHISIAHETIATALIDGDNGLGRMALT